MNTVTGLAGTYQRLRRSAAGDWRFQEIRTGSSGGATVEGCGLTFALPATNLTLSYYYNDNHFNYLGPLTTTLYYLGGTSWQSAIIPAASNDVVCTAPFGPCCWVQFTFGCSSEPVLTLSIVYFSSSSGAACTGNNVLASTSCEASGGSSTTPISYVPSFAIRFSNSCYPPPYYYVVTQ